MQRLWATSNTYTIYRDSEEIGWIRFIKYAGKNHWRIQEVSERLPVSKVHWDAEGAKEILDKNGLTWKPGENKKQYLYE